MFMKKELIKSMNTDSILDITNLNKKFKGFKLNIQDVSIPKGFAKRDSYKFEYLKSSEKYIIFVKRALIIDMFRRFINTVIIELIFGIIADLSIIFILFSVGITYFFAIVTISVERFFDTFTFIYIITCFFILLYCVTYYILTNCRFMLISGLAMLLVCILILVKKINFLIKRTKEAYYDR